MEAGAHARMPSMWPQTVNAGHKEWETSFSGLQISPNCPPTQTEWTNRSLGGKYT